MLRLLLYLDRLSVACYRRALHTTSSLFLVTVVGMFSIVQPWFLALFIVAWMFGRKRRGLERDTHGSARWASLWDLWQGGCLHRERCLLLGQSRDHEPPPLMASLVALFTRGIFRSPEVVALMDARQWPRPVERVYLPDPGPPHLAIFGASGSGKSTAFVIPNLLTDTASAVVLDPKGELFRLTAKQRRRMGQQIVVIDPFHLATKKSDCFNPLTLGKHDPRTLVDNARRLAASLVVKAPQEKEPFWNSAATVLLQTVIAFLMSEAKPGESHLNRLRDLTCNPKVMRELLDYLAQSDACEGVLRRLAGTVKWYQGQTESSIYSVANTHLEFLDSLPVAEILARSSFDPWQLVRGKMSVYILLPIDRLHEMRGLQRILVTSLINLVFEAGESRSRRVRFYLDEAASLGEEHAALSNALVFGRSFGIRLLFSYQSAAQVEQCFPESKAHDFRATVASVFCGVYDYETAKQVSQYIGQTTVQGTSTQTSTSYGTSNNEGVRDNSWGTNRSTSQSTTYSEVARALIQPEEILQLPPNLAIALLPNIRPILLEKRPYYTRQWSWHPGYVLRDVGLWLKSAVVIALLCVGWANTLGRTHPVTHWAFQQAQQGAWAADRQLRLWKQTATPPPRPVPVRRPVRRIRRR